MKRRIASLLLMLSMCLSLCVANAGAAANPERIDRTNGRSDGTWLFPAPSKYFDQFTDWAGCPGMGKCKLCGKSHSSDGWGDTSHTGQFKGNGHNGFDIATPSGTSIYAAADGTVRFAGYSSDGRGNTVVIEHPIDETWSYYSYYQHLKSISVKAGKTVSAGTEIAKSGNSGGNYGAHLHFGIVMGKKGKKKSVLSYIGSLECKGFLKKSGFAEGSILVNPSTSSIFPKGQKGVTQPLGYHSGSVAYTFDKSKVSIGPSGGTATVVKPEESTLAFEGVNAPTTLKQGEYFSLKGTVSSNYDIASVKGEIVSTSGKVACTYTQKPNATSFQLLNSELDYNMTFNKLLPGEYTLRYTAEDASGKNVDWNSAPFSVTEKGKKNYDPNKALAYAAKHWNDGKGLCAEFVSDCLKAGGCDVWSVNCGDLLRGLKRGGWGTVSEATVAQNGHVYVQDNQGKLGKGDLLIYYCNRENSLYEYTHTVIISGMADDGRLLCYAHNDPKNNAEVYAGSCGYCGGLLTAVYAVHMKGVTPYTAESSRPEKEPSQQPDPSTEPKENIYAPQSMEDDIFFDAEVYYALHPDLAFTFGKNEEQLYEHWISCGIEEGRTASLIFDARWYLEVNPDVAELYGSENYAGAYDHYLRYGIYEGRSGSPFFNARFYLDRYQDLTEEYGDDVFAAARHFVTYGIYEERTASEYFSVFAYAEKNPDVAETFPAVKDRFIHYIRNVQYGTEERSCT